MDAQAGRSEAARLMARFAERTGLTSEGRPQRYLWTDAYALRNFLALSDEARDPAGRETARALVAQVHRVLGRHRREDPRSGWISGLPEEEGARHPTAGGLRIGKPLPERGATAPIDERLEWDRDGQYFHYLTKWMDALAEASTALDEPEYRRHAVELGKAVVPRFLHEDASGEPVGLFWKMSIDLSRPQVPGVNPQDVLDGYVTLCRIRRGGELEGEIAVLRRLAVGSRWGTADPLGLGGLLSDASRLARLPDPTAVEEELVVALLAGADAGLQEYLRRGQLSAPASRRLAFRELGLAIGLHDLAELDEAALDLGRRGGAHLRSILSSAGVASEIVDFWADGRNRHTPAWLDHRDINEVMLATALLKTGPA